MWEWFIPLTVFIVIWGMVYYFTHITLLVGGLDHFLFFHSVGNVITPTDEVIFFRGVGIPPTR